MNRVDAIKLIFLKVILSYRQYGLKHVIKKILAVGITNIFNFKSVSINDYTQWILTYQRPNEERRNLLKNKIERMSQQPLISILMPTYNSNLDWLKIAINSVQSQIYQNWELCIADDGSTDESVKLFLHECSKRDHRIKVYFREENGHISQASNSALSLATGTWVALLDHDDELNVEALFWIINSINNYPYAKLIYTDEDKINTEGIRSGPYFKSDWNRQLFYGHNLICHLGVYSRDLLVSLGGFRIGYEGAQDYDLALRCIEIVEPREIVHIPRILYHWRIHNASTAKNSNAKPYAMLAGERALNDHFKRIGLSASATLIDHGYYIQYELPQLLPLVTLIIPTRNGFSLLSNCVNSILNKTDYQNYEILIIDNGSDDITTLNYLEELAKKENINVIIHNGPFNYSEINNKAVGFSNGEIIALINNDIEVISPNWLTELVSYAIQPDVGAVGPKLLYGNDTIQHAGIVLGIGGWAGHAHKGFPSKSNGYSARLSLASEFSAVTGACLVVRKEIFQKVGGLDAENLKIACNDVDFCLKVNELGYRNIYTPFASLYHHESATRGYEDTPEKKLRFKKELDYMLEKWGNKINNDPMYNPNLTLDSENFGLAWPPRVCRLENLTISEDVL